MDTTKMPKDQVAFGCTIVVKDLDFGDNEEFTLVGAGEEDYDTGRINVASPLAQGFVGKKIGDQVEVEVPAGTNKFEILEIKFEESSRVASLAKLPLCGLANAALAVATRCGCSGRLLFSPVVAYGSSYSVRQYRTVFSSSASLSDNRLVVTVCDVRCTEPATGSASHRRKLAMLCTAAPTDTSRSVASCFRVNTIT